MLSHRSPIHALRVVPSFSRAELPDLLAIHDAGLFTSQAEGWGLVLNEMIEAGVPVYATNAGGVAPLRAVLPWCLCPNSPAVGAPMPDPPSEAAFALYRERFSWQSVARRYVASLPAARASRPGVSPRYTQPLR